MRSIVITPQSPAQGWNCYWVRTNTNIRQRSFQASNDNIKSKREPRNGHIQGHLCPALEDLGLIACYIKDTELSLLVIYLLPAAHTLWRWFYLHLHPPSPLHPWCFGLVSWRKRCLMIFWYIFLFMLFWGLCGWVFFLLHDALWFGVYFEAGSRRKFDTRGFSWWSNVLAQTQLFQLPQSASSQAQSRPLPPSLPPSKYAFHLP